MEIKLRIKDPLFYLAVLTLAFWAVDSFFKIFILHSPQRMLWYSSVGLGLTSIALFKRNSFLITSLLCLLLVYEGLWTVSFFSGLFSIADVTGVAAYSFAPDYSLLQFVIGLYHLILVPSLIVAIVMMKRVHPLGWLGAGVLGLTVAALAFVFPDPGENVNCVQKIMRVSCQLFPSNLYELEPFWRIFLTTLGLTFFMYVPINILLLLIQKLTFGEKRT